MAVQVDRRFSGRIFEKAMSRPLDPNAPMLSAIAPSPWGGWLFGILAFAGLCFWAMFIGWTTIVTSRWWAPPGHDECIWLMLATGVILCANAACTVWALLILPAPLGTWHGTGPGE